MSLPPELTARIELLARQHSTCNGTDPNMVEALEALAGPLYKEIEDLKENLEYLKESAVPNEIYHHLREQHELLKAQLAEAKNALKIEEGKTIQLFQQLLKL